MPEPDTPLIERPWEQIERMVSVDAALARALGAVEPLEGIDLPILEALGLVTTMDIVASESIPPFRNSAMDGFAVRAIDTGTATWEAPLRLTVVDRVAAGEPARVPVGSGEAVRIMTGAPMPDGADAVVRFEETDEATGAQTSTTDSIGVCRPVKPWDNVRPAGEDVERGTTVLFAGTCLRPQEIGLLAALGEMRVSVHRRPRVAVLSTGNEVVAGSADLAEGMIRDSNSFTIAAMVQQAGAEPVMLGIARDDRADLTERLHRAATADLIVTSGGVSLGDYDMVKDVLQAEGSIAIWQVRMKPGKPLAFGQIGSTPLIGLPGNPVAAAVSFEQFARPAIRKMLGHVQVERETVKARLLEHLDNRGHRRHYVRAVLEGNPEDGFTVRTAGDQGAGVLTSLVRANALLIIPETLEVAEVGSIFDVQPLDASSLIGSFVPNTISSHAETES